MPFDSHRSPELVHTSEELDVEKNHRLFRDLPSSEVQFFAIHLARPDGFAKTLITGQVASSSEISSQIPDMLVKTRRENIGRSPVDGDLTNDYISFSVGLPKTEYGSTNPISDESVAGLGFITPVERLLSRPNIGTGGDMGGPLLLQNTAINAFQKSDKFEPAMTEALDYLRQNPITKYAENNLLTNILNVLRKMQVLTVKNTPEIHLYVQEEGRHPRLSLSETIALCPERSKPLIVKILKKKLKEMRQYAPQIKKMFGIDIDQIDSETILDRLTIYWYPQNTITEAVEYLSTHKARAEELLASKIGA